MPQDRMHGGLDGGAEAFPRPDGTLTRRIGVLLDASSCLRKINGHKDFVTPGVRQPFARCLNPEDSVDLDGGVARACLHKQRIAAQPC
jgi:hypothetical protein